jgi:hypothetical protein
VTREVARAATYGSVRVFTLDVNVYAEPAGLWTRGDAEAALAVSQDAPDNIAVKISAGPSPIKVEYRAGHTHSQVLLGPGESRILQVPTGVWHVRTEGGFRPSDHEAGNKDARWLGARLEFQ